jgi:hypothetical protein
MKLFSDDFLNPERQAGDAVADSLINEIFADPAQKTALFALLGRLTDNKTLGVISSGMTSELFVHAKTLPEWADKKQMDAGAAFFARYSPLIMNLLALLSLPYCYAGANGAMVLYLSEKIRNNIEKRLYDTAGFIWDVMAPDAFLSDGKGFVSILKVRLNHAAARYYTYKSGQWDDKNWGVPVNQEDMAGTNLSFSVIVIRGLRKMGATITEDEQSSFLHLWNVIGFMLGVKESLLPKDGKQAFDLEQSIRCRQFKSSPQGIGLTQSLTNFFKTAPTDTPLSHHETLQLMRYLLGNDVADILDLPNEKMKPVNINLMQLNTAFKFLRPEKNAQQAYRVQYKKFKALAG